MLILAAFKWMTLLAVLSRRKFSQAWLRNKKKKSPLWGVQGQKSPLWGAQRGGPPAENDF